MNLAATLLFAFVPMNRKIIMHVCEERILAFLSDDEQSGYDYALRVGKEMEIEIEGSLDKYAYTFIGVIELVELSLDSDVTGEIWSRYVDRKTPIQRSSIIIPQKHDLNVFLRQKRKTGFL